MRYLRRTAAVAALLLLAPAGSAMAQGGMTYFIGGSLLSPAGDFGDYAKSGYGVVVGVGIPMANPKLGLDIFGFYGHAEHEGDNGEATNLPGVGAGLNYMLGAGGSLMPYISGFAGVLQHRYDSGDLGGDDSETQLFFGPAGGVIIPMNRIALNLDARYFLGDTQFLAFTVGIGFGGGM